MQEQTELSSTTSPSLVPLPYIHRMQGTQSMEGVYLVYPLSGEAQRIQASTASEAIQKCTIPNPRRVLRYDPLNQVLLAGEDFCFDEGEEEAAEAQGGDADVTEAVEQEDPAAAAPDQGEAE